MGRPYFCTPIVQPSKNVHVFGLMIDGDEMGVKLGESGGRAHVDTVLAD